MMISRLTISKRRQRAGSWVRHTFHPLWRSKERWAVLAAFVGLAMAWAIVVNSFPVGATSIVTHYTIPFGIDGIGSWWVLWLLPAGATFLTLLHYVGFIPFVRQRSPRALPVLHTATVLLNFGIAWTVLLLRFQQVTV